MFELCPVCGRPIVNEYNLKILRRILIASLGLAIGTGFAFGACLLPMLGFTASGVAAGSWAAAFQGPVTMAGSTFALLQSLGATGMGTLLFGGVGSVTTAGSALFLLKQYANVINWCTCHNDINNNIHE